MNQNFERARINCVLMLFMKLLYICRLLYLHCQEKLLNDSFHSEVMMVFSKMNLLRKEEKAWKCL